MTMAPIPAAFDYNTIDPALAVELKSLAARARSRVNDAFLEVGRTLVDGKAKLGHGKFEPWVEYEFGFTLRKAEYLMRMAEFVKGKGEKFSLLLPSVLQVVAGPGFPKAALKKVEAIIDAGGHVSVTAVKELARELSPRRLRKEAQRRLQEQGGGIKAMLGQGKPVSAAIDQSPACEARLIEPVAPVALTDLPFSANQPLAVVPPIERDLPVPESDPAQTAVDPQAFAMPPIDAPVVMPDHAITLTSVEDLADQMFGEMVRDLCQIGPSAVAGAFRRVGERTLMMTVVEEAVREEIERNRASAGVKPAGDQPDEEI